LWLALADTRLKKEHEVEKETKRTLQRILDTMQEQQSEIRALRSSVKPSSRNFRDGLADRIERMVQDVSKQKTFSLEWDALCDRGLATRHSGDDDPVM
jgi:signal transduction histidine kinase